MESHHVHELHEAQNLLRDAAAFLPDLPNELGRVPLTDLVKELHHPPVDFRLGRGVAGIPGVAVGRILVPILEHPCRAGAAAAVHVDLRPAGQESAVAKGQRGFW